MSIFNKFNGKSVILSISGTKNIKGQLIDIGTDIFVIYNGKDYLYIPKMHVHSIKMIYDKDEQVESPTVGQVLLDEDTLSLRKVLHNAKGIFSEVFITSNQSIHGYITNIMNDYFIFFSPIYKIMFIPLQHLKWLIPYKMDERPFALSNEELPLIPFNIPLARTFTEQCKKYTGKLVIFDLGKDSFRQGKLVSLEGNQLELIVERKETVVINIQHIKTVHLP